MTEPVTVGDEITFAAMIDSLGRLAGGVQLRIVVAEEIGAFLAEHHQQVIRDDAFEDHVTLVVVKPALFVSDNGAGCGRHGHLLAGVVTQLMFS